MGFFVIELLQKKRPIDTSGVGLDTGFCGLGSSESFLVVVSNNRGLGVVA